MLARLLNTLTQALHSSGVDLTQANISVQIDLGKRANGRVNSSASTIKVHEPFIILETLFSSRSQVITSKLTHGLEPQVINFH